MSEAWAYAGGLLMVAATLPQARHLLRARDAAQFSWSFTLLNLVGISLLALRSWEIRETAFVLLNVLTAAFWALVVALKAWPRKAERALDEKRTRSADVGI